MAKKTVGRRFESSQARSLKNVYISTKGKTGFYIVGEVEYELRGKRLRVWLKIIPLGMKLSRCFPDKHENRI